MKTGLSKRGLLVVLAAAFAAMSVTEVARADVVHAGVSLDAIVPSGMVRTMVVAPAQAGMPVRVVLASSPQGRAELVVDVAVLASSRAARAMFAQQAETRAARVLPAISGLGDAAAGGGRFVLFVRDNIVVAVLATRLDADVTAVAQHIDDAVVAAPAGAPSATRVVPRWNDRALTQQSATRLTLDGDLVASEVSITSGPARVRRLRDGWLLMRTAPGRFTLSTLTVDSHLRVSVTPTITP